MVNYEKLIDECVKTVFYLYGQYSSSKNEEKIIIDKIEIAKKWLQKQPDYLKFLQHLQMIIHQKNIGVFSELLSYFVQDVLRKDKKIELNLYTYHNLPALKIEAVNNGNLEDIYYGNGGSIVNIVSAGLRLIALSRLKNRKFIILDEPECWLEVNQIPLFANIIGDLSKKINIQTVIISHHSSEYFKEYGKIILLKEEGKYLIAEELSNKEDIVNTDNYIKKIVLKNFMSHYNTVYDLHPTLTCIVGKNDIGKSVIATALRAVAYGDSGDNYIMHDESVAEVKIELSNNVEIIWNRYRETNEENPQKVKYTLNKDGFVTTEYNSNDVPLFINNELKISEIEGVDIHIGNQKQPVFLLSSDIKPQDKAKILSLGKESMIIQKMMEEVKSKTRENRQTVKENEKRFALVNKKINSLKGIENSMLLLEKIKEKNIEFKNNNVYIDELKDFLYKFECVNKFKDLYPINPEINVKELNNNFELNQIINGIKSYGNIDNYSIINIKDFKYSLIELADFKKDIDMLVLYKNRSYMKIGVVKNLEILNLNELKDIIKYIEKFDKDAFTKIVFDTSQFSMKEKNDLKNDLLGMENYEIEIKDCLIKLEQLKKWEIHFTKEGEKFLSEHDSKCPTCKQIIDLNILLKG